MGTVLERVSFERGGGFSFAAEAEWPNAEDAFRKLKLALQTAPALGLPDPSRPFTQTVDEKGGFMSSVLLQEHGGALRPVAYFSGKLDPVAAGLPRCVRAVAAAEKAVYASRDLVGYADLTLLVPHAVSMILAEQRTSRLSAAGWLRTFLRYEVYRDSSGRLFGTKCTGTRRDV